MSGSDEQESTGVSAVADLGSDSMRSVYRDLLRFGPRSRSELTKRLGLSAPTVTRVTRDLLEADRLHPLTAVVRPKGRPREPLDIVENRGPLFIGVKVTADEVHTVVTTVRGNTLEELVLPLTGTTVDELLEAMLAPVEAIIEAHPRLAGIGVSLGGLVARRRTVVNAHLLGWQQPVELAALLEARVGLPVVVENDLVAMVNGLHWFGIGRSYDSFAVLTVGAGVGIGTVIDGRVLEGRNHMAGLTGRVVVGQDPQGSPLAIRDVASTDAVVARAQEQGVLEPDQGIEELRALVREQEPAALEVAQDLARMVALAAAGLVAVVDPEAIVLGGENVDLLKAARPVFEQTLRETTARGQRDLVVRTLSGDFDEWARGAAVIAIQEFVGVAPRTT